ncbi:hypothetical protein [Nostoc parmelioides]|uniref:Uncharacterized protein n=1 Tax=Nostoc parmelioides FACHB-3921 TaxID=2692909 RepID=A0ABR8BEQ3_9NOSO|nr:hypothetical protein [Nostoc parmelioides]MBD2252255.1 hypothetical protein [Nostoc parmelioides FACHB-3921]
MVKITISDLSPDDEGKSLKDLTNWELKSVYAGLERRYGGRRNQVAEPSEESTTPTLNDTNGTLDRWMDSLELQIQDLRKQLGINS